MIGPQFKLTGPSARGISTELFDEGHDQHNIEWGKYEKHILQPVLDIIELRTGNRIDVQRRLREVFEDKHHIELLQAELDTLQGCNLDIGKSDDEEGWIRKMNQTFGCRLQPDILADRHTFKRQFTEGNVHLQGITSLDVLLRYIDNS